MRKIIKKLSKIINKMEPTQIMVMGFAIVILIGAILLSMPISTQNRESIGFLDALFTSTSAVCVTGLIAVDTSTYWSFWAINNYNLNTNWWIRIYDYDNIICPYNQEKDKFKRKTSDTRIFESNRFIWTSQINEVHINYNGFN